MKFNTPCCAATLLLQEADSLLVGADLHVILGDVAQHGDHRLVVVGHRGVEVVLAGDDRPPQPAPEVELPSEVEAEVPLVGEKARSRADGDR